MEQAQGGEVSQSTARPCDGAPTWQRLDHQLRVLQQIMNAIAPTVSAAPQIQASAQSLDVLHSTAPSAEPLVHSPAELAEVSCGELEMDGLAPEASVNAEEELLQNSAETQDKDEGAANHQRKRSASPFELQPDNEREGSGAAGEPDRKRRKVCSIAGKPAVRAVATQATCSFLAALLSFLCKWSWCFSLLRMGDFRYVLTAFCASCSVIWGAEAVYSTCSMAVQRKVPETPVRLKDRVKAAMKRRQPQNDVARGHCGGGSSLTEEVWKEQVLYMLKNILNNTAAELPPSRASSVAPSMSPGRESISPGRASSAAPSRVSDASSRESGSPAHSLGEGPAEDAGLESLETFLRKTIRDADRGVTQDQLVTQIVKGLEALGPEASTVVQALVQDIRGVENECPYNRIGPPPSSWGQRLSAEAAADTARHVAEDAHEKTVIPRDPSGGRNSAVVPTPPPRSRCSWVPEGDVSWFARSPCFNLSSAQQAARLQAAISCEENPPAQDACYANLLAKLPPRQSLQSTNQTPAKGAGPSQD